MVKLVITGRLCICLDRLCRVYFEGFGVKGRLVTLGSITGRPCICLDRLCRVYLGGMVVIKGRLVICLAGN